MSNNEKPRHWGTLDVLGHIHVLTQGGTTLGYVVLSKGHWWADMEGGLCPVGPYSTASMAKWDLEKALTGTKDDVELR